MRRNSSMSTFRPVTMIATRVPRLKKRYADSPSVFRNPTFGDARVHRGARLHRNTYDADRSRCGLQGAGDTTDEPASGDGHDDRIQFGEIFEKLEPNRALPGNYIGVVEGRDFGHSLVDGQPRAFG